MGTLKRVSSFENMSCIRNRIRFRTGFPVSITVITLFLSVSPLVYGYDFKYPDSNGNEIFYSIQPDNNGQVTVTREDDPGLSVSSYSGTVIIPETVSYEGKKYTVTAIGENAFSFNNHIKSIIIPKTVLNIGIPVAVDCDLLTVIEVAADNPVYSSAEGVLLDKSGTRFICCPGGRSGSYRIPTTIKDIDNYAFLDCHLLTSIDMPDSLRSIGALAFSECASLESIVIPEGAEYIGWYAFKDCPMLSTVQFNAKNCVNMGNHLATVFDADNAVSVINIGQEVKNIPDYAFYGCSSVQDIDIPDSVERIGVLSFSDCRSLEKILLGSGLKTISEKAFSGCSNIKKIQSGSSKLPELPGDAFPSLYASLYATDMAVSSIEDGSPWNRFNIVNTGRYSINMGSLVGIIVNVAALIVYLVIARRIRNKNKRKASV